MRIQALKSRDDGECKGDLIYYSCVREEYTGCCLIDPCDANKYPTGCPKEYQSTKRPQIDGGDFTMGPGALPVGSGPPPSSIGERWHSTTTIDGTLVITLTTTPDRSPAQTPAGTTTTPTSFSTTTTTPGSSQPSSGPGPSPLTAIPTASTTSPAPSGTPGGGLISHGTEQGKTSLNTGTLYGIIAGAAGLVTLVAVLAALLVTRYRKRDRRPQPGSGSESSPLAAAPNSPSDGGGEDRLKTPLERDPNLILHWRPPMPPRATTTTEAGGSSSGSRAVPRSATVPAPAPPIAAVTTPQPGRVYRPYRPPIPTRRSDGDQASCPPLVEGCVHQCGAVVSPVSPSGQSAPGNYATGMSANWSSPSHSAASPSSPGAHTCSCSSAGQSSPVVYSTGPSPAGNSGCGSGSDSGVTSPAGPSTMIHRPSPVATISDSRVVPQRRRSRPQTRYELDAINNQISELDSQVATIAPVTTVKVLRATPRELEIRGPRRKSAEEAVIVVA